MPNCCEASPMDILECRKNGKDVRFRFHSQASAALVLQILAQRGAISNREEQALATRVQLSGLPDTTEAEPKCGVGVLNLPVPDSLLERNLSGEPRRGDLITEQREWVM